ncbi:unnamed protein product [Caenorhabditis angaria]|uniref:RING-type domain-containing protein n=1 Tax=Caenorhabditis angaria TaxID=860376 RepID=A0A9P1IHC1_9PELO|nr:unnamed protein product [Caenorhabditis angaria]
MAEQTADLNEGDRVLISEIFPNYSQRRNLYSQLMWTKMHLLLLGHVGYLKSIDREKQIGVVVVMYVPDPEKFELCQATCEWPLGSLKHPRKVFFACGDSIALTRGKDTASVAVVSRVEFNELGEASYTVIARNSYDSYLTYTIENRQSPFNSHQQKRDIFICPIYSGPRLAFVMRDNCSPAIHSYKHTIHGYTTENLMSVISNWRDDSSSYAKLVESIRANPEQIRTAVDGELPLFRAVSDDNWSLVVVLLALGADKFSKDLKGRSIIHIAAERGFDRMLEGVLSLLEKEVNRTTKEGDTPLHLAARNAHAACIDRLLATPSCQSNIQNENGDAPLHEVCLLAESSNKKAAISRLLTNSRASIHQTNNSNLSPLQIAIMKGHVGTVEQLIQLRPPHRSIGTKSGMTPLHFAASCANVNIVNKLVALGMEVHRKDKLGRGVLHYAVEKWTGQAEKDMARLASIQSLVHSGAPSNVVDVYGQTPLHLLIREIIKQNETYPATLIPICAQLVKTNLNLDEMASRLRPHWQLATMCFFVANGADINIKDRKGLTVLDLCQESTIRPVIVHISNIKIRSCLPMVSMNCNGTFDSAEVTMCTFMCQDNIASVRFVPCGHRVACVDCAQKTAFRRCPLCYQIISQAQDNLGNEVIIGCRAGESVDVAENSAISEQIMKKIAEDAAREAKIAVEHEKMIELKALRERLEQLEMETSCAICMDSKITLVFNCGHTACSDCASKLKLCHICRKTIESKQTIYS